MKIIKNIIGHMEDTLKESEQYVYEAALFRDEYPTVSKAYIRLAEEHINHYDDLHSTVVNAINEYKRIKGAPPESMQVLYNYLHERLVEEVQELHRSIDRLKNS